jgi:hypothetical protein
MHVQSQGETVRKLTGPTSCNPQLHKVRAWWSSTSEQGMVSLLSRIVLIVCLFFQGMWCRVLCILCTIDSYLSVLLMQRQPEARPTCRQRK